MPCACATDCAREQEIQVQTPLTETESAAASRLAAQGSMTDQEIVLRVLDGDTSLFEVLMRRYNRRLYRVVRPILRNDADAEDAVQYAYLNAYRHLTSSKAAHHSPPGSPESPFTRRWRKGEALAASSSRDWTNNTTS
jgi:hypothetical protein